MKTTPFLDEMAKNGTILTNSYATHRCSPSRAGLLTGRYPFRYGLGSEAIDYMSPTGLDPKEKLLPQYFKDGGYSTHMVGKWHLGFCKDSYKPSNRGFDTTFGLYGGQIEYFHHTVGPFKMLDYFRNDEPVLGKSYCGKDFTDEAIDIAKVDIFVDM